jgi:hypothetical protein
MSAPTLTHYFDVAVDVMLGPSIGIREPDTVTLCVYAVD